MWRTPIGSASRASTKYHDILPRSVVVIENGLIGTDPAGAEEIDAHGGVLLPGLIDSHLHTGFLDNVLMMRNYGLTTAMDMACTGGAEACNFLNVDSQAVQFVSARLAEDASYIKVITESPGMDAATLAAIVNGSHAGGRKVMSHAPRHDAISDALAADVDFIHHIAADTAINSSLVAQFVKQEAISVPTLIQMLTIANTRLFNYSYPISNLSANELFNAGVPILAGSDATGLHTAPNLLVPMGISLHQELELLVGAGLSSVRALQAATSLPAKYFNLQDRGAIAPGFRADLVLVHGDPITNISVTQEIERVWVGGVEFNPWNRTIVI
ncbi:Adenine deaminase [Lachnellula subtilissima]|uniref:Adenine deaminase n=1 Tax=Lachnellula subtilissima TaxID=602034 RepID=A0A8H8U9L1_9HELO|nr:Adenine deaminase [Lachnellula subtilissima]